MGLKRFFFFVLFSGLPKIIFAIVILFLFLYWVRREMRSQRNRKELNRNSVVLISNACRGIGKELAIFIAARHHCKIVIFDTQKDLAKDLLLEIQNLGAQGYFYECDFRDKNAIMIALAQTIAELTHVDLFIHTGGFTLEKNFEDYCYEELSLVMETNFLGPSILIKELLSVMKNQSKGHIAIVPSTTEVFSSTDIFTYCGARGALVKLAQGLQAELKKDDSKVKISVVRPLVRVEKAQDEINIIKYTRKVRVFAEKIYDGIIEGKEEICSSCWAE